MKNKQYSYRIIVIIDTPKIGLHIKANEKYEYELVEQIKVN